MLPNPAQLPQLSTFTPATSAASGLDLLAAADAGEALAHKQPGLDTPSIMLTSQHVTGPYNPAAALPPKVVKRILALEFIEMAELRGNIWPDDACPQEGTNQTRCQPAKPPVDDIRIWLECYGRMAAVLVMRFPEKAPELWVY